MPENAVDALAAAFARDVGGQPDGVWAAPGRVNLLGEHTDYNDGFVLPVAVDLACRVAARRRPDGLLRVHSRQAGEAVQVPVDDVAPGRVSGWSAYALGVAWALRQQGVDVPGADLLVDSEVPAGAGLSSSAALECAVGMALCALAGITPDRTQLALAGQRAETDVVGAPVGVMDQIASMHGEAGSAVFLDCRSLEVERVPLPLEQHGLTLLVVDTRVTHAHATGSYAARRRECEEAARVLGVTALRDATAAQVDAAADRLGPDTVRRARHVVTENARVLQAVSALRSGDLAALGPLLAAGQASLRDDFEVSCPELDVAVRAALDAGAAAARMTGGGFGGSVVALVPTAHADAVGELCRQRAARAGAPEPKVRPVQSADGAHRVR